MKAVVPAFVALIDDQDRVYLQRRFQTGYLDGRYEPPVGKVEEDETPSQGACREALEEAGVTIEPEDLELFHAYMNLSNGKPWLGLMFRTRKWKGTPSIQEPHRCDDARFFSLDELPEMTPQVADAMRHVLDGPAIKMPDYRNIT